MPCKYQGGGASTLPQCNPEIQGVPDDITREMGRLFAKDQKGRKRKRVRAAKISRIGAINKAVRSSTDAVGESEGRVLKIGKACADRKMSAFGFQSIVQQEGGSGDSYAGLSGRSQKPRVLQGGQKGTHGRGTEGKRRIWEKG